MKSIILDTETTGLKDPRPVQIAWIDWSAPAEFHCQNYNPGIPITFGAMATHHITNEDVADCPPHTDFKLPDGVEFIIGHNIGFDLNVLKSCGPMPEVKSICTLAMSQYLYPDDECHTLTAMLYMLDLPFAKEKASKAHDAFADVLMTQHLLSLLIKKARADGHPMANHNDLWLFSEMTRTPTELTFGKHKGTAIADIPASYRTWLLSLDDLDPYLRKVLTA